MLNNSSNFKKHTSKNPLQRLLIDNFYKSLYRLTSDIAVKKVLDAGCGEGFTLHYLFTKKIGISWIGIDSSEKIISTGKQLFPSMKFQNASVYTLPFHNNSFDLVLCNEVLEHLSLPDKALQELVRVSSRYVLLSVPHEPFFMVSNLLRGKNIMRMGNDIEHINHWTNNSFRAFIRKSGLDILRVRFPFPWMLVLCEVKKK